MSIQYANDMKVMLANLSLLGGHRDGPGFRQIDVAFEGFVD